MWLRALRLSRLRFDLLGFQLELRGRVVCVVEARFPQGSKISGGVHGTYCTLNAARQLEKNGGRMSKKDVVRRKNVALSK